MRRATVKTVVENPEIVANAVRPDNTEEMHTTANSGAVETTIERETTGGLRSSLDDYVVNLDVASTVVDIGNRSRNSQSTNRQRQPDRERRQRQSDT
ncbi:MAG: KEOPS complex subunit Pcc1 [Halodesulfurarchaeum sp.]